ncbi:complement factor H-like isoform X4 [Pimephales promelas]|uniref:complement factor H-like isoform X4 n=1 Tax=Pimephales promelas TaxID=90988 RepID=UPI001955DB37|nr:complement factor H-like isoform X4 [Pimephales promelas]
MRAPVKLLGFVFWLFSLNFAQSQALASQTMKVPALGRPLFPGMLYDCRKDTFIPGVTLWDKKSLIEDLDSRPQSRTDLKFSSSDSLSSKSSLLDVTASLKASFLGGLVEVGGSAMFLRNTKSSNQQSRVTMYYSESTRFEQLTMSHLGQITYPQVFDQKTATHVVTGVLYGAQAIMVFDRTFSEEEEKQEIEGELNVMVKKIPLFSIEGQGAVKMTDGQKKVAEKTTCTFHGDFRLDQNPTAYMEALELYKKLPNILKENPQNAVPIKVWLYPLFLLDTKAAQLEREISTSLVFSTEDIIEKLGEAERTCNDLSRKPIVNVFKDIKERLLLFQRSVNIYKTVLLKAVAKVLPAIRGGEMEQNSLENILKIHYSSPFNADILNQWLDHAKTELNLLSAHTEILKGIRTEDSNQLNTILFNPSIDVVVCLTFTSLKYEDPDLSTLKSFLESVEFEGLNVEKPQSSMLASITKWFNDPVIVSKMRKNLSLFRSFSENNKDEKGYRFIISAISDPSSPGSSIYLYETGNLIDTQFQPVSKPPPPEVKKVLKDSVSLKLQKSSTGETVQYRVEYQQVKADSGSEEQWIVINTDDEIFTLTGLEFGKQYMIRYRIVGKVGVSEASDTIGPIQSLQVTCELKSTTVGVKRINPEGKTIFRAGESVEITCTERYWIFRTKEIIQSFTCGENGQWDHEPVCAEIRCKVPDDQRVVTPEVYFNDLKLGEKISYACMPGYDKMSAEATCTRDGWTPNPLCAEVTCELKSTRFGIKRINPEGKTIFKAGESVEITCTERYSIFRTKEIIQSFTCGENGQWDHEPACAEIRCEVPRDQHVYSPESYFSGDKKLGARISYYCTSGYDKMSAEATCTRDGWTPNPLCAEVTCELKSTTYGVRRINPEGKTIFKAGESVEITCTERYWIFGTKENIQSFTCGENGQWDHEPVCAEIRCEVPRDQYVSWPDYYFSGDKKLGARTSYACVSGYYQMSAEATCTRDGWTPKPLCAGNTCAAPNIPNAAILGDQKTIYNINSRIQYQCNPGFEPEQPVQITCTSQNQWTVIRQCTKKQKTCRDLSVVNGFTYSNTSNKEEIYYSCNTGYKSFSGNWWDSATCNKDSWSDETQCIPEDQCGAFPSVHHGKLKKTKQTFRDGDKIEFECDPGFIATPHSIRCINGKWEKPVCKVGVHCDIPPKVENALITSKPEELYVDESSVTYACRSSFSINGTSTVFCRNGIWEETPTCEEIRCKVPDDQRLVTPEQNFTDLKLGEKMSYACMTGYDKMSAEATCTRDGWTPNPLCADEVTCELKSTRFGIKRINPEGKTIFKAGESVEITCTEKHWFYGTKEKIQSFTCGENGQWDHEPVCAEVRCEVPRGQYVYDPEYYFRGDKKLGARKSYYCTSGYDQMFEATCTRDGWTPNPLCAVNTCAAPIIPNVQILGDQRTKYNINSRIQYQCNPGFKPEQPVQITCNSQKQWTGIQQCTEIRCEVPHNQHVYDLYSYFRGNEKLGAKMSYACVSGYYQMSVEATCTRDGWTPNPLCAVNTCAAPIIPNAAILGDQRIIYNINSRIQYQCNPGFEPEQPVQITCTSQNQWTGIQECTGIINENTCKVPDDHRVSRPELYFTDLKLGATISYYCMSGYYQMSAEATCTRDGWTPNPLCADGQ